jgi:hypothetical protein
MKTDHRKLVRHQTILLVKEVRWRSMVKPGRLYIGRWNGYRRADRCVMQWTGNVFVVVTMATLSYGKDKYGGKTELEVLTVL